MAKIDTYVKERVAELPRKDLEKLVIKAVTTNQQFYDFLLLNYLDKESGETDLFEKAKADIELLFYKNYKGYSPELKMANMLSACSKRINEFDKLCKDKSKVMDLILMVIEIPFSQKDNSFTTCFTQFNYRVFLLLKKAMTILQKKIHEDYHIQYAPVLKKYLEVFYRTSSHLDYVYNLKKEIGL